ncbi:hypothetical protein Cal7507_3686 [Calothrix sp. PCC 7507]|nr:hypothetical protein Cal7507_3686 [Calothrix sp. PCC 7507]
MKIIQEDEYVIYDPEILKMYRNLTFVISPTF